MKSFFPENAVGRYFDSYYMIIISPRRMARAVGHV
jgi:hypothetical protein